MKRIIKFEKDNCNPCTLVSNFLEERGVNYTKINAFNSPDAAMKYKIRSLPTVILLDSDEVVKKSIGFNPKELEELIADL